MIDAIGLHPILFPSTGCPLPHRCCTKGTPFRVVPGYGQGTTNPTRFPQRGRASSRNPLNTRNKIFNLFTTPINPSRLAFGIVLLQTSPRAALTLKPTRQNYGTKSGATMQPRPRRFVPCVAVLRWIPSGLELVVPCLPLPAPARAQPETIDE